MSGLLPEAAPKLCSCVPWCLYPLPKWYNREAEQLNAYIKAYVAHNDHVVLIEVYNRMRDEVDQKWEEYYETPSLLHPNREKGHPILNNLLNVAVDLWMQDKQEVLWSSRLNTSEQIISVGHIFLIPTMF